MKLFLSTWITEQSQGSALTTGKAVHRLSSFWFMRTLTKEAIEEYVKKGTVSDENFSRSNRARN
jgi:hypothetical protein